MTSRHRWACRHRSPTVWRPRLAATTVGVLAATTIWVATNSANAATLAATVSVSAGQSLSTFPATEVGANVAVWDSLLADSQIGTLWRTRRSGPW